MKQPRVMPLRPLLAAICLLFSALPLAGAEEKGTTLVGADGARILVTREGNELTLHYRAQGTTAPGSDRTVFIALQTTPEGGSAVLPFAPGEEGSTVFLPFRADHLFVLRSGKEKSEDWKRVWEKQKWSDRIDTSEELPILWEDTELKISFALDDLGKPGKIRLVVYSKDFSGGEWGRLYGASDPSARGGAGDQFIAHYHELDLTKPKQVVSAPRSRLGAGGERVRIYQLLVRLFGNTKTTRKQNGTLAENGSGRFADLNEAALTSLREMGFTHLWLTGVLQQATGTDYAAVGEPADDVDLLKGIAGSPYAIRDYFDVSPDYARDPAKRLDEFKALLQRIHARQMKALIDFVPNHVARSYASSVKPEFDFGRQSHGGSGDRKDVFFDPLNNFFYLKPGPEGPPLRLPTVKEGQAVSPTCLALGDACDGLFPTEKEFGRVTGNNVVSWQPALGDWYETIKLNYGFDFTASGKSVREYPNALTPDKPVPDTWLKMDAVLAHWQALGVDGFRCDMAHMVPPEFWTWAIGKARRRNPDVFFVAEAYDNDPAKVPGSDPVISGLNGGKSNVMFDLLNAGFDAVYDDPSYKAVKNIYDGSGWANDVEAARSNPFIFENSLRYAENHDEVRLAAKDQWGKIGPEVGRPVSALLYGIGRGPIMLYHGQEVGEPADGAEGFGGDDARTSIFDYWSMPAFLNWVNGGKYDGGGMLDDQRELRDFYGRLLRLMNEPAFRDGDFFPLNAANNENPQFGRGPGETAGGHWLYAFLRHDPATNQRFLGVINLHPRREMSDVSLLLPAEALRFLALAGGSGQARPAGKAGWKHRDQGSSFCGRPAHYPWSPTPGPAHALLFRD